MGRGRGGGGKRQTERQTDIGTGVWKETRAGEGLCASTKNELYSTATDGQRQ